MTEGQSQLASDLAVIEDRPLFVAYNANVDAVIRVDDELEEELRRPTDGSKPVVPGDRLASKRDLAAAITNTMTTGEGDERILTDELAASLEGELHADAMQIGGQAGIMTDLLSAISASPVLYTYLLSETQRSMFDHPAAVRYPFVEDGAVRFAPLDTVTNAEKTKINWIFEFRRGDEFFGVRADSDTRLIAASRPPEFDLRAGDLDDVIDQVGTAVDGALLSGYHNLTPETAPRGYDHALRHARDVLRRLRSGGDVPVHVEYAVTHDDDLRAAITEYILPEANAVGLDPQELRLLGDDVLTDGRSDTPEADADDRRSGSNTPGDELVARYRTLTALRDRLGVDCLRLHALDYHLAVTDDYLPPEAVRRGLEFAAVNAATKAATGDVGGPEALSTGLDYDRSVPGREAIDSLADAVGADTTDGVLCTPSVVACPNRVVEDPVGTVGIGDIVSAASFALEVAVANDAGER